MAQKYYSSVQLEKEYLAAHTEKFKEVKTSCVREVSISDGEWILTTSEINSDSRNSEYVGTFRFKLKDVHVKDREVKLPTDKEELRHNCSFYLVETVVDEVTRHTETKEEFSREHVKVRTFIVSGIKNIIPGNWRRTITAHLMETGSYSDFEYPSLNGTFEEALKEKGGEYKIGFTPRKIDCTGEWNEDATVYYPSSGALCGAACDHILEHPHHTRRKRQYDEYLRNDETKYSDRWDFEILEGLNPKSMSFEYSDAGDRQRYIVHGFEKTKDLLNSKFCLIKLTKTETVEYESETLTDSTDTYIILPSIICVRGIIKEDSLFGEVDRALIYLRYPTEYPLSTIHFRYYGTETRHHNIVVNKDVDLKTEFNFLSHEKGCINYWVQKHIFNFVKEGCC